MRLPPMARRTTLGFLLAALVGILVGNFLMPAFGYAGIVVGVLAAMAVDVYIRNRDWRRQQRDEGDPHPEPRPARTREGHRPQPPRDADADGSGRHRRRRRRR